MTNAAMSSLILIFGLGAVIAFIVVALIQVAREPLLPPVLRVCWVIVLVGFPIMGTLIWFGFGHGINQRILSGT
ncbi:hypothetical protein [Nesterenkonia jeotgali]|uniref:Cardiolipin synthase N-terminal domain-containing protein n=1 Tax=Nesterenkonia jeotgali TaxID=317018 RepID=A0A0W8IK94_9MICC|nr:hypothetical protein [Nesterenkonia jeotgali]KUG60465.1 hypothetical protein AVL63_08815 [Nesterenkonia jeotgali]MBA8922719.1 hypothetical protein [Nesterenkonia jeotgali]